MCAQTIPTTISIIHALFTVIQFTALLSRYIAQQIKIFVLFYFDFHLKSLN